MSNERLIRLASEGDQAAGRELYAILRRCNAIPKSPREMLEDDILHRFGGVDGLHPCGFYRFAVSREDDGCIAIKDTYESHLNWGRLREAHNTVLKIRVGDDLSITVHAETDGFVRFGDKPLAAIVTVLDQDADTGVRLMIAISNLIVRMEDIEYGLDVSPALAARMKALPMMMRARNGDIMSLSDCAHKISRQDGLGMSELWPI